MTKTDRRIPAGEWVLVTGANGYIASHVVDVLLEEGYNVRGTVRAQKPWLNELFEKKYGTGRFETSVVPVLEKGHAFDEVVKGVSGIIHLASDVSFDTDPTVVIPGVVAATVNMLKAAAREPSVKSVVLTSSSSAALLPEPNKEGIVVDENTWDDAAVEAAYSIDTPKDQLPFVVYAASKTEGERALWKWAKTENPGFVVNAVLPNMAVGTILSPEIPGSTMGFIRDLLAGKTERNIDMFPPQWYINVRDCARVHVAALLDPTIQSQRLFAFAGTFNFTGIIDILRKLRPNNKKIPNAPENEGRDLSDVYGPSRRAEQLIRDFFGVEGWTSLAESLADGITDLE